MIAQYDSLVKELAKAKDLLDKLGVKPSPPSVKKGKANDRSGKGVEIDVPDGIIAHLTRECGGNVHDCRAADVTSGSFEKATSGANPHSGAYGDLPRNAAKNADDLETNSRFCSAYRVRSEDIGDTRNNWICYDFKERRIVPTHYTIRTNYCGQGGEHLKSWVIETSADGESWRETARKENTEQLNGQRSTGTFAIAGGGGAASSGW
jgi:hypothetical protein